MNPRKEGALRSKGPQGEALRSAQLWFRTKRFSRRRLKKAKRFGLSNRIFQLVRSVVVRRKRFGWPSQPVGSGSFVSKQSTSVLAQLGKGLKGIAGKGVPEGSASRWAGSPKRFDWGGLYSGGSASVEMPWLEIIPAGRRGSGCCAPLGARCARRAVGAGALPTVEIVWKEALCLGWLALFRTEALRSKAPAGSASLQEAHSQRSAPFIVGDHYKSFQGEALRSGLSIRSASARPA